VKGLLVSVTVLVTLSFPADSNEGPRGSVFVDDACGAMGITLGKTDGPTLLGDASRLVTTCYLKRGKGLSCKRTGADSGPRNEPHGASVEYEIISHESHVTKFTAKDEANELAVDWERGVYVMATLNWFRASGLFAQKQCRGSIIPEDRYDPGR
jgi:hypothetical protein